ncbi:MAG: HNH endonuclease signature motif containing protein [Acidimicrobiales bacterium]
MLDQAFISLLIHDNERWPIDASPRRRLPTRRQRRVTDARHPTCTETGCTCRTLLQADHLEPYAAGGSTTLDNLTNRCGPHNRQKSAAS